MLPSAGEDSGIGTPDQLREHSRSFEEARVDEVILFQQGGPNRHDRICESLELFAAEVMPEFAARERKAVAAKTRLAVPLADPLARD